MLHNLLRSFSDDFLGDCQFYLNWEKVDEEKTIQLQNISGKKTPGKKAPTGSLTVSVKWHRS
jgi:hypothetical protein